MLIPRNYIAAVTGLSLLKHHRPEGREEVHIQTEAFTATGYVHRRTILNVPQSGAVGLGKPHAMQGRLID
jgi:hypothetical protein